MSEVEHPAERLSHSFGDLRQGVFLQAIGVAVEFANSLGQLLRRHRVFVVHPAEACLVQLQTFILGELGFSWIELAVDNAVSPAQFVEQFRTDRQKVRTCSRMI